MDVCERIITFLSQNFASSHSGCTEFRTIFRIGHVYTIIVPGVKAAPSILHAIGRPYEREVTVKV